MDDYKALITEALEHIEVYDFDKLEEGSWPWTMRHLVDAVESQRSRIAALEAVIQTMREAWEASTDWPTFGGEFSKLLRGLSAAPSVVLDQMIREAKAEALEEAAGFVWPNNGSDAQYQASVYLRGRAAAYRNGDA